MRRLLSKRAMPTLNPSIRTQLLSWLVIPLLLLLLVGAGLTYGLAISLATDAYDKSLLDSVYSVAGCVQMQGDKVVVDLPPAALQILRDNIKDQVYYQVVDEKGKMIAGDAAMPPPVFDPDEDDSNAQCRDDIINKEEARIACVRYPVPLHPKLVIYIQVGETLHGREQIADEILIGVVLPQLAMVVFTLLVVWYGVARGLKPLNNLRDAVAQRTPVDLSPIATENVPKEVRPLVKAINELLERLESDIQAQRRFVANAAHQLRTPIAGLKTQTELALRQNDPADVQHALSLIHTSAERAARLVNQLLALARAEPGAASPELWQAVDLNEIGRTVCREFVQAALAKKIDLGFEASATAAQIRGDSGTLHELAANLVDNAVLYTQAGGHVTVKILTELSSQGKKLATLVVEDNGPGINEAERERVFERFYRSLERGVTGTGTGLGLAIVREIAIVHGGEVSLKGGVDGKGTAIWVSFPLVVAPSERPEADQRTSKESPLVSSSEPKGR